MKNSNPPREKARDFASPMDEPWMRQLLTLCGLPHEDLTPEHLDHFWVIKEEGETLGTVGLEIHGRSALLRSLAVDPRFRKRGFASQLTKRAEDFAASLNIKELYLLTMTAESFFRNRLMFHGFQIETREYHQQLLFPSEVIVAHK